MSFKSFSLRHLSNVSYSWSSPIGGGRPLRLTLGCRSVLFVALADISHWRRTTTPPAIQMQVCHICTLSLCTSCLHVLFIQRERSRVVCLLWAQERSPVNWSSLSWSALERLSNQEVQHVAQPTSEWFCPSRRSIMLLGPLWSDARTLGRTPMIVLLRSKCWP